MAVHDRPVYVRVNTLSGGYKTLCVTPDEWTRHPDGDDLAVTSLPIEPTIHQVSYVSRSIFITENHRDIELFGVGDECFAVGRHVGLDGKLTNTPAARFGALSMFNAEPIYQAGRAFHQESIVVECRSLGGFSGSAVFINQSEPLGPPTEQWWVKPGTPTLHWELMAHALLQSPIALLGISWGHMEGRNPVQEPGLEPLDKVEKSLATNSGMMLVVPAWKIGEVLDLPNLAELRQCEERDMKRSVKGPAETKDDAR